MNPELLAARLAAGKAEVSQKMRWWLFHSGATALYLERWRSRRKENGILERQEIRRTLEKGVVEWNRMAYGSQCTPFMKDHVTLEADLVDLAMGPDTSSRAELVGQLSERMRENVLGQVEHHGFLNKEFPVYRWKKLLLEHAKLFAESIRWFTVPDMKEYEKCQARRMENSIQLAALSTEWL
jgi:hypothetical protein